MENITVSDIIEVLDAIAPRSAAQKWDNVGLQVGHLKWPVRRVMIALDAAPLVVQAACERKIDLLVTHHPLIFRPLSCVDFNTPVGRIVQLSAQHRLAVFSAHTNLDAVAEGLNDILARKIGLFHMQDFIASETPDHNGIGRVGDLPEAHSLSSLAGSLRNLLGGTSVRFSGMPDMMVRRVAICTGSGGSLMDDFLQSGADVFITGDLRYHDARSAEWANVGMIDIGHFASEHLMVNALTERLDGIFRQRDLNVKVEACDLEKDPFIMV